MIFGFIVLRLKDFVPGCFVFVVNLYKCFECLSVLKYLFFMFS